MSFLAGMGPPEPMPPLPPPPGRALAGMRLFDVDEVDDGLLLEGVAEGWLLLEDVVETLLLEGVEGLLVEEEELTTWAVAWNIPNNRAVVACIT